MLRFHTITCCCSNGLGSSMVVSMNVRKVLQELGITGVLIRHIPLSECSQMPDELFIAGLDIMPQMKRFSHVIILKDLISRPELTKKLKQAFETDGNFLID